ncbi:hypothetical protein B9J78_02870 [bacterium Unc6]|nr:hypothetical protein [bacterium Unc6]
MPAEGVDSPIPLKEKEKACLIVPDKKKKIAEEDIFSNIEDYFQNEGILVLNDTRVIPARREGRIISSILDIFLFVVFLFLLKGLISTFLLLVLF